jgi:hypothetical protein
MKGSLWMKSLSLSLFEEAPLGGEGGSSFTGDPGRYVEKVFGYGHLSPWGPLPSRGEPGMQEGGSYTEEFDR